MWCHSIFHLSDLPCALAFLPTLSILLNVHPLRNAPPTVKADLFDLLMASIGQLINSADITPACQLRKSAVKAFIQVKQTILLTVIIFTLRGGFFSIRYLRQLSVVLLYDHISE